MQFFTHHKVLIRKVSILGLITVSMAGLLFVFAQRQESIENTKLSYIKKVYFPTLAYRLHSAAPSDLTRNIASVAGVLMGTSRANSIENDQAIATSIPVLVYHGVVEESSEGVDGVNLLIEDFSDQMAALKEAGYKTITYEEFEKFSKGEIKLPAKSILITFDDGRKDSYYPVDPILQAYGYHATIFILPKYSLLTNRQDYYLSKRELQKMIASGRWSIQSHSMDAHMYYPVNTSGTPSYYYANKLWLEDEGRLESESEFGTRILRDLNSSKATLESELGIKVSGIAYPFGQYGQNTINNPSAQSVVSELTQEVYSHAFYQTSPASGFFYYSPQQGYLVRRIEPRPDWDGADLLAVLDTGKEKEIPFTDTFDQFAGWVKMWGEYTIDKSMILSTNRFNKETFVFLDGTQKWNDYVYSASMELKQAEALSLVVNMTDQNNYQTCLFGKEHVRITDRRDGKEEIVREVKTTDSKTGFVTFTIQEKQGGIICLVNGTEIATSSMRFTSGGTIGLKLFGGDVDARVEVKKITVSKQN